MVEYILIRVKGGTYPLGKEITRHHFSISVAYIHYLFRFRHEPRKDQAYMPNPDMDCLKWTYLPKCCCFATFLGQEHTEIFIYDWVLLYYSLLYSFVHKIESSAGSTLRGILKESISTWTCILATPGNLKRTAWGGPQWQPDWHQTWVPRGPWCLGNWSNQCW